MKRKIKSSFIGCCVGKHGFTMIELLTAMAVLGIMLFSIAVVFTQVDSVWRESYNRLEIFQNARIALDLMTEDLANAVYQGAWTSDAARYLYSNDGGGTVSKPLDEVVFWTMRDDGAHKTGYRINDGNLERLWSGTAGDTDVYWTDGYPRVDVIAYHAVNMGILYWTQGTETWDGSGTTVSAEVVWPPAGGGKLPPRMKINLYMLSSKDAKKFANNNEARLGARKIFSTVIDLPLRKWDK